MNQYTALRRAAHTLETWGGRSSEQILQAAQQIAEADETDAAQVLANIARVFLDDMAALVDGRQG